MLLVLSKDELEVLQWHINALLSKDNDDQTSQKTELSLEETL